MKQSRENKARPPVPIYYFPEQRTDMNTEMKEDNTKKEDFPFSSENQSSDLGSEIKKWESLRYRM